MKNISLLLVVSAAALMAAGDDVKVPFEKYKLKNGMRVILAPDNSVPVVSIYVLYNVGSRSEEKGHTGFAHLFEHMMFEGSANAPKGMHFKSVEANGGSLNGSTHPDFTDYFEIMPSNKLAVGLWLESDRMRSLAITEENLKNQKEAVKAERRLSFDNRPYNTAVVDAWPQLTYRNWQSSHSLIGSFEDLNASSVADVAKFFRTYYAPNNAILCIAGDIRIPEAKKWIEGYFGDIAAQPQPQRPDLTEPSALDARNEVYKDKLARVPAVLIGWPGPARRSADYNAMVMADVLLTGGESSRFQQDLVKGKQSVLSYDANPGWPFASASDYKDPALYAMEVMYNPKFTGNQIVEQVQGEIAKIQSDGVGSKELERARTFLKVQRIKELQNSLTRARLLAQYEMFDGNPALITSELNDFLSVTGEQIQALMKKYLVPEKRVTLNIVPAPQEKSSKEKK
jgi:zinc protease